MSRIKIGKSRKHARLLQEFAVTAADINEAEQQLRESELFRINDIAFAGHWFCRKQGSSAVILPFDKLVSYCKDYSSGRYGVSFFVRVLFAHEAAQAEFKINCDFDQLDEVAAEIQKRCPHAVMRRASEPDYDPALVLDDDYDPDDDQCPGFDFEQ